ncbi:MAG TPA: molybdenum ABC transporter ATP-binding protein [Rugosibacter sp.]
MSGIQAKFQLDWPGFSLDVDLALPARGITALFGSSGSGKTTLLRCIAGLEKVTQGRLVVNGEIWQDNTRRVPVHQRPLGYVFQEASLFAHLTVLGNLRYGVKRVADKSSAALDNAIELLGIGTLLDRLPDKLSGGERQRVAMARALALSPRLLLMDEPLAALDYPRKQEIMPYLQQLHRALDIPVLYVSHAADEVARLADYLVVIDNGRVRAQGLLAETLTQLDSPLPLGEDVGTVLDATVGEIDTAWHLARVDFAGGSLWTPNPALPLGCAVRVRVLARDVSLAATPPEQSSIQNVLRGQVDALADDTHPGLLLVRVQVGGSQLLARVTRRAAAALQINIGQTVWVQVKTVALMA